MATSTFPAIGPAAPEVKRGARREPIGFEFHLQIDLGVSVAMDKFGRPRLAAGKDSSAEPVRLRTLHHSKPMYCMNFTILESRGQPYTSASFL